MIDREQRNMLKDLILTSKDDVELQDALDKYERGDTSQLDSMIRSGTVFERYKTDLDLLDDLDLDFLSFNNDVSGDGNNRTDPDDTGVSEGITDEMNMAHAQLTDGSCPPFARSQTIPLPSRADQQNDFSAGMSHLLGNFYVPSMAISAPQNIAATTTAFDDDDGIGDLDFNGDYSVGLENGEDEELANSFKSLLADGSSRPSFGQMPSCASNPSCRGGMPSSFDLQRSRADSLQLSALLGEARLTSDELGQWTEGMKSGLSVHSNRKARDLDSHVVGGIYLLNTDGGRQATWRKEKSPALGRRKSTSAINRESAVLERKRVRQLKKSQKEREKGEGKAKGEKMRQHSSSSPRARRLDIALKNNLTSDEGEDDNVREVPSGLGLPRSRSDPNLSYRTGNDGLLHVDRPDGWVGAYSPDSRKIRIERFAAKRNSRVWVKTVKYDVRKNFADSRFRVKGRFVKKEDEQLMRGERT